jgi:hypothetical protein
LGGGDQEYQGVSEEVRRRVGGGLWILLLSPILKPREVK